MLALGATLLDFEANIFVMGGIFIAAIILTFIIEFGVMETGVAPVRR